MKMESMSSDLYPLTSLQIGDVQSNLSQAYLYFAPKSHKFVILVDNQSWRVSNYSRSAHIRELLITKCRTSPFRNTKALLRSLSSVDNDDNETRNRWDWLLYAVRARKWKRTAIYSMMDLRNALHGFIVFQVLWKDVRGINYLNEIQSDTSMAFEVKSMRKWEFSSINQASRCMSSWFSGTPSETRVLQRGLRSLSHKVPSYSPRGIHDNTIEYQLLDSGCQMAETLSQEEFRGIRECNPGTCDTWCRHHQEKSADQTGQKPKIKDAQDIEIESTTYEDTLLKVCFIDRDLPFKFKEIITSDLRLLTLVESGLPFWVIFLQSYPLFCKIYRPWMRPLVRTLYLLISLVTVMIGFYDLYKNVPLLKATASHLCAPLFNWIEDWDMISRIQYLGTMLFLQNFEKAVRWSLGTFRGVKLMALMLIKRLYEPFEVVILLVSPVWLVLCEIGSELGEMVSIVLMPFCSLVVDLFQLLFSPFELLFSFILMIVGLCTPLFTSLCVVPTQTCIQTAKYAASVATELYEFIQEVILLIARNLIELTQLVKMAKTSSSDVSMWNTLWRDLLSKVFRSLRSVINGLAAFLNTCNRHRLSIYNHLRAYMLQLSFLLQWQLHGQPRQLSPIAEAEHDKARSEDCSKSSSEEATACIKCGPFGVQKQ